MSWKKYFKTYDGMPEKMPASTGTGVTADADTKRYSSWLPEVYQGQPNRVQRYGQYDQMDLDSEVNTALDTIAEFSTLKNQYTKLPFEVEYQEEATDTENDIIQKSLRQWCNLNDLHKRIFRIFRNSVKYGDQVFVRDPETYKLFWVDPAKIEKVIVNEGKGKKIEAYYIKDMDVNLQSLNVTADENKLLHSSAGYPNNPNVNANTTQGYAAGSVGGTRYVSEQTSTPVDAKHVVHISLSEGIDGFWPFGNSVLEPVFKVYKQKELLEDAILIYRVQRAPERRVFYIDVGNMPTHKARAHLERIKNDIHQRRIPSKTGGGQNITDSAYNPLSIMEDYFFAQTAEGRGSKVETLPGGTQLGEIDDLRYFNDKLMKGLRVPSAYLPSSPNDPQTAFTDGRVGTAYIQEFRFTKFCKRIQNFIQPSVDREFKMFLKNRGIEIDSGMFELQFNEPQNFGKYRQIELDTQLVNIFNQIQAIPYISKRFAMKRFMKMTEDEIYENQRLWAEENSSAMPGEQPVSDDLGAVGGAPMPASGMATQQDDVSPENQEGTQSPIGGTEPEATDTE